jgi:hypothetical protein
MKDNRQVEPADKLCEGCGNWFMPVRDSQRYCRPSCRDLAAWRREHAGTGTLRTLARPAAGFDKPGYVIGPGLPCGVPRPLREGGRNELQTSLELPEITTSLDGRPAGGK